MTEEEPFRKWVFPALLAIHTHFIGLALLVSFSAQATGTLEKIVNSGSISLGYRETSSPFSYLDEDKRPIGYSLDICLKVVAAVKRELKRPDIAVQFVPVSTASRITALTAGEIDLECGSTTNTPERRKLVSFTIPTFIAATRLMVRNGSEIKTIRDLNGKVTVTTKGSSQEKAFNEMKANLSLRSTLLLATDNEEAFSMIDAGKADAFIMGDVLLYSMRAEAKVPEKFVITRDPLTIEPISIVLRKDDPAFKKLVDTEIARLITQREIHTIYRMWFESPIPPRQTNLKLPMSYMLRDSFRLPTDWVP